MRINPTKTPWLMTLHSRFLCKYFCEATGKPPSLSNQNKNLDKEDNSHYWQHFFGEIKTFKVNFKHCLVVIGWSLEKLFYLKKGYV